MSVLAPAFDVLNQAPQYKIIKVITFYPRFVIKNSLGDALCVRPAGSTYTLTLQGDERQAVHWWRRGALSQLVMSYPSINKWYANQRIISAPLTFW